MREVGRVGVVKEMCDARLSKRARSPRRPKEAQGRRERQTRAAQLHIEVVRPGFIKKKGAGDYVLIDPSNRERSRWGNLDEMVEDGMFFVWNGHLPAPSGGRW